MVLGFWETNQIFKKAERKNKKRKQFVFYEGPPTANGRPGIHHVLGRSFKDIVLRYKTMRGFNVYRRGGWDTHGLPVELEVEKELGLKSKKDIEKYGIAEFNQKCKESVWKYKDEWENLTRRIGFWIDLDHPYITYENSYIEKLWWIIKEFSRNKLLYKAHKVVPWCTRCGTAVSSHELAQGYSTITDTSVIVQFKILNFKFKIDGSVYILAWTTTPWTLPGNVALAIGPKIKYVLAEKDGENYVVAKDLAERVLGDHGVKKELKGKDLVGLKYEPLFDIKALKNKNSHKIYAADFVTTDEGTGVVHTAVMYGEDDYELGKKYDLPQHHTVDEEGKFTKDVSGLSGMYVKDKKTEEKIIRYLRDNDLLLRTENYRHDYPFCWRCESPIIYYARDSWFIAVSKLRGKLQMANSRVNWVPEHIKEGRFGGWLKEAKDWAISRERYWGTPLPVWECSNCGKVEVIGGYEELSRRLGGVKNRYIFMRHGEAVNNKKDLANTAVKDKDEFRLTLKGRSQVERAAKKLKSKNIDHIFASDFRRTRETAQIISDEIGVRVNYDKRLREINLGEFNGRPLREYRDYFVEVQERFSKTPPKGENLREVALRIWEFVSETEKKYRNKTILVVSHEEPIWMAETVMRGWSEEEAAWRKKEKDRPFINTAEFREIRPLVLPRNEWGIADPHKPYVDKIIFKCLQCDGKMKRVKEVIDVWFDSGAMPFASDADYPADYIVEGVDQTRGWFYTLLAVAVSLGKKSAPYKNAISYGHVLDKNGQKMSKSRGNVVDPWEMTDRFGADAIRWYFYTVNSPGEPKKFNELDLAKSLRNFILTLYNSFSFLNTYCARPKILKTNSRNVLDKWIFARLHQVIKESQKDLDNYDVTSAARKINDLTDDISRWYIRRSRKRLQRPESKKDFNDTSSTLALVLVELSKILAPFVPFFSEALYRSLKSSVGGYKFKESVHLEDWPKANNALINKTILRDMAEVRRLASIALAEREKAGIKIRQPLKEQRIRARINNEMIQILNEEANVHNTIVVKDLPVELELDTKLTHELKEEGWLRELVRTVQEMRQKASLKPGDRIVLGIETDDEIKKVVSKFEKEFLNGVGAKSVSPKPLRRYLVSKEVKLENHKVNLTLKK